MKGMPRRWDRTGMLAIEPRAFFDLFFEPTSRENEAQGDVALVTVRGPLQAHRGWWCDSYEDIVGRVAAACETPAKAVVLVLDSPGGDVAGMLEAAQAIQAKVSGAGKRLLAFVDGRACSAAYALACVAEQVIIAEQALVGSIGVLNARLDVSAAAAAQGVTVALITSGARKADGHPQKPLSEAELAATQTVVDQLAASFFAHVASQRGLDAGAIEALEARVFAGSAAVAAGLADAVGNLDTVLALASAGPAAAGAAEKGSTMDEARKALQAIIDDDNADEASKARAKKALAAMDEDDGGDDKKKDDEESKSSKAEGDDEDKKDEEAKAMAAKANANALKALSETEALERRQLIASRPDLDDSTKKLLASAPIADVRSFVESAPRKPAPKAAATAVVSPTRAQGQGDPQENLPQDQRQTLDMVMGLAEAKVEPHFEGRRQVLPVMTRLQREAYLNNRAKAQSNG